MSTLPAPDFYGHTIFCDDIRQEAGGKVTFIGVYTKHMIVHGSFPCFLPKFGLWIQYNQHQDHVVKPIRFFVFLPGDPENEPSIITEIPEQGVQEAIDKSGYLKRDLSLTEDNPTYVGLGTSTVFSPFVIQQPGLIKVRAERGEDLVRLGSLAVLAATDSQLEPQIPDPPP